MSTQGKAQFTPVCTCEIVMRTGETLDSSLGDRPCSDVSRIVLCQFHTAAPAMYEALSKIAELRQQWRDDVIDSMEYMDELDALNFGALSQAEGR